MLGLGGKGAALHPLVGVGVWHPTGHRPRGAWLSESVEFRSLTKACLYHSPLSFGFQNSPVICKTLTILYGSQVKRNTCYTWDTRLALWRFECYHDVILCLTEFPQLSRGDSLAKFISWNIFFPAFSKSNISLYQPPKKSITVSIAWGSCLIYWSFEYISSLALFPFMIYLEDTEPESSYGFSKFSLKIPHHFLVLMKLIKTRLSKIISENIQIQSPQDEFRQYCLDRCSWKCHLEGSEEAFATNVESLPDFKRGFRMHIWCSCHKEHVERHFGDLGDNVSLC